MQSPPSFSDGSCSAFPLSPMTNASHTMRRVLVVNEHPSSSTRRFLSFRSKDISGHETGLGSHIQPISLQGERVVGSRPYRHSFVLFCGFACRRKIKASHRANETACLPVVRPCSLFFPGLPARVPLGGKCSATKSEARDRGTTVSVKEHSVRFQSADLSP